MLVISRPAEALGILTLLIAAMLFVSGVFRSGLALFTMTPLWGASLLSGIVSIFCGVMIAAEWPESAIWVVGTFVGVSLLMRGVATASLGWGLRGLGLKWESRKKLKTGTAS